MNNIKNNLDGWLVINKELGMTSSQVVNIVKKTLNVKKVGHAGTLDPLATGVLALAVGKATKSVKYIMDGLKKYSFTIKWGISTDTQDAEGKIISFSKKKPNITIHTIPIKSNMSVLIRGDLWHRPTDLSGQGINDGFIYF